MTERHILDDVRKGKLTLAEQRQRDEQEWLKRSYGLMAVKYMTEYADVGEDIVRMITQYIGEGFMDWGQGLSMLRAVFNPDGEDD
jgi:hypothetical protein